MNLLKYIVHKKLFFLGFLLKTVEVITELFLPIFMGFLIKKSLEEGNFEIGFAFVGLIILFAVFGYISTIIAHKMAAKVSQGFSKNLRKQVFYKAQELSYGKFSSFSTSKLINIINLDISFFQNALALTIRIASRAPVLMIGSAISLFILNPKIALILVIGLPIIIIILIIIMNVAIKIFQKFQIKNDKMINIVASNIEGARMIRAFSKVEYEVKRFDEKNNELSKTMILLGKVTSLSSPLTTLTLNILMVIMFYVGIIQINKGIIQNEQLIQVITYTTQLSLSIISVMNLILLYTKTHSAGIRINEFLETKEDLKKDGKLILDNNPVKIEFKNVYFKYDDNSKYILKNINFTINKGETFGIVGLTGSGKTTIADLIIRLYDVTKGEILINDINIKEYDIKSLRDNFGVAFQKAMLFKGSVEENIAMNKKYNKNDLEKSLINSESKFILKDEKGLDIKVLRDGMNFSGGQRQRLALSRALIKKCGNLILDDIFSALDYITDLKIREKMDLEEVIQTKIFISQRLSSLFNAHKIAVIENGKIKDIGTHDELISKSELYQKIYNTQILEGYND